MTNKIKGRTRNEAAQKTTHADSTPTERIRDALAFIPVGGHDERVRVAFMLKSEFGDQGRDLWDEWRDGRGDDEAGQVWKSASEAGPLKIGTLIREAKSHGWQDDGSYQAPTPEAIAENRRKAAERAAKDEAKQAEAHKAAADKAATILKDAKPAPADHAYLIRKGIKPSGARLHGDALVIPGRIGAAVSSLQFIGPDGVKRFLTDGQIAGGYFSIGKVGAGTTALCICEGFATGASIHEATGHPVAVSFNAGNLLAVAKAMRAKFPDLLLILCADDDWRTAGNPGMTKGTEAARAVGGLVAVPMFGADREPDATDFNDMAALCGLEAVGRAIAGATAPTVPTDQPGQDEALAPRYASSVELLRASDITPEPVDWYWPGWLAAGKMHVLGGAPGTGKTTISMALAATLTTGGRWPDGSRSPVGNVVIWSGEDDPADTLVPRLALSGADLKRVYFIADVFEGNDRRAFDPAKDMEPLRRKLADVGDVRLLIVDPIVSAVAGDSHKNAEVRRSLQPLVDLAASMRCALLGITHFSKGTGGRDPVERLTGSLAFGALARVVLVAAKQQEDGEDGRTVRIFLRAKSNIGPDDGGFEYDLQQGEMKTHPGIFSSSVLWGNAVEGAARELLATADATGDDGEGGTGDDVKHFLSGLLADGAMTAGAVFKDADGAGFSKRAIQRIAGRMGVLRHKDGMRGGWLWKLPPKVPNIHEGAEGAEQNYLAPSAPSAVSSAFEVEL
jgi:putative DNA primase/helicase